ncbi:MAG: homoserine kinase [Alphaproteobacteria bacterium]|nr:homoserine kinase [Alphaproteobacteria bacterium]
MAVYTHVDDRELTRFVAEYDIGELVSYKGIAEGVENSNYLIRTVDGGVATDYILTLYEARVAEVDLPYFLRLVDHLSAKGICPSAVHGRDGEALRRLAGRPAAVFTFLDGLSVHRIEASHCRDLGGGLARLHLAGADFPLNRANDLSIAGWRRMAGETHEAADQVLPGLAQLIAEEVAAAETAWPAGLPEGVIHADLFPDNVFFLDGRLSGFIDFYFACNDLLAYDLAVCLNAWCFDGGDQDGWRFDAVRARALFEGYGAVRKLAPDEVAAMPTLARGAALRFLLTRTYDLINHREEALVQPKDPKEYLAKLVFHRDVQDAGAYGI